MDGHQCICGGVFTSVDTLVAHVRIDNFSAICMDYVARCLAFQHTEQMRREDTADTEMSDGMGDIEGGLDMDIEQGFLDSAFNQTLVPNQTPKAQSCFLCHRQFPLKQLVGDCPGCTKWFDNFMAQQVKEFDSGIFESDAPNGKAPYQQTQPQGETVEMKYPPSARFTKKVLARLEIRPTECPFLTCNSKFGSLERTREHIGRCKAPESKYGMRLRKCKAPRLTRCSQKGCDELFVTRKEMFVHLGEQHGLPTLWNCPNCGYEFPTKARCIAHIRNGHCMSSEIPVN